MVENLEKMAQECFGYGRWEASYWFVGPEQGMNGKDDPKLQEIDLRKRLDAWISLGCNDLDDCRTFHLCGLQETRWHNEPIVLQKTWDKLMIALLAYLNKPTEKQDRRDFQKKVWGSRQSNTCVIEISGVPSPALKKDVKLGWFLEGRIREIQSRINDSKPKFIIMYNKGSWNTYRKIIEGARSLPKKEDDFAEFWQYRNTIVALTPHPSSPAGSRNIDWVKLGNKLREGL